jgi:hypothetical protein
MKCEVCGGSIIRDQLRNEVVCVGCGLVLDFTKPTKRRYEKSLQPTIRTLTRRFRKKRLDFDSDCDSLKLIGKHQYKRVHEDGKYVFRCRSCGKKQYTSKHSYVTAKGIIEEWLSTGHISLLDSAGIPYIDSGCERLSDLGLVYELSPKDSSVDAYREAQAQAPTGELPYSEREMKRRYKKMEKYERMLKNLKKIGAPRREIIRDLRNRIHDYCIGYEIEAEDLSESLVSILRCIIMFDEIVLSTNLPNRAGDIKAKYCLTLKELESIAAAATYHYIPELTQEQVVGNPKSIFPNVTRPTLIVWHQYVKCID